MEDLKDNYNSKRLKDFTESLKSVPTQICEAQLKVSNDEDEKSVITTYQIILKEQFENISSEIEQVSLNASKQNLAEVDKLLKISSGNTIINNIKGILPNIGSLIGKLGIDEIVKAIKKIIRKIFELLNKTIPTWLDAILVVIDEFFEMLFGGESASDRMFLSQNEQNFLAELTNLENLERATELKNSSINNAD